MAGSGAAVQIQATYPNLSSLPINFSGAGDNSVIPNSPGLLIRVYRIWFVVAAVTNITFKRGSTLLSGAAPFQANGSLVFDFTGEPWWNTLSDQEAFIINSSNAVAVTGQVYYEQTHP